MIRANLPSPEKASLKTVTRGTVSRVDAIR